MITTVAIALTLAAAGQIQPQTTGPINRDAWQQKEVAELVNRAIDGDYTLIATCKAKDWSVSEGAAIGASHPGLFSPDRAMAARVEHAQDTGAPMIQVRPVDDTDWSTGWRTIHQGAEILRDPVWTGDSTGLVGMVHAEGKKRIGVLNVVKNARGEEGSITYLVDKPGEYINPHVSASGDLAYCVIRDRKGKETFHDLVLVRKDGSTSTVCAREMVWDLEFSPDGQWLAYSTFGHVHIVNVKTLSRTTHRLSGLVKEYYNHAAHGFAWRPDSKAVASLATFTGGRAAMSGEPMPVLYGDREVLVLGVESGFAVRSVGEDVHSVRWEPKDKN